MKMKNIKLFTAFFILLSALSLSSCTTEVEPIDPAVLDPILTGCTKPTSFHVSDFVNGNTINLNWVEGGQESSWEIEYGTPGFTLGSGTTVIATNNDLTIDGLDSAIQYEFYIRGVCSEEMQSTWVGPVSVNSTSVDCIAPTSITAVRNTDPTKITMSWTAGGSETAWKIQYGTAGFTLGSGTVVDATSNSIVISGLSATQAYDFYILSACSATDSSNWAGPKNVPVGTTNPNPGTFTFMNANVNGTQYNGMKPYFYPFTGEWATENTLMYGPDVLVIQGNSNPLSTTLDNFVEINLSIPKVLYHAGTYELLPFGDSTEDDPKPEVNLVMDLAGAQDDDDFESEIAGSITVTEFNFATKRVTGTFTFTYIINGEETPVHTITGTFDYPIDPEAID